MKYNIPYGRTSLEFDSRNSRVLFSGKMTNFPAIKSFRDELIKSLEYPIASKSLGSLAKDKKNIVILVEDNTRKTPLNEILPIVVDYLAKAGVPDEAISFLTAPGTHRVMTHEELREKMGDEIMRRFRVIQHDSTEQSCIVDLGEIEVAQYSMPVHVNKLVLDADLLIGVGNIVPHSDAGFSGGAKIVQPGVCDFVTTQATHRAAGLCQDITLGVIEGNPCRAGIDMVGAITKLAFIINTVKNCYGDIVGFFCGDYLIAHRAGVELARKSFGIEIDEQADIVIVSSYPADIDYWQGIKGLSAAYFAVRPGGTIILAAPCYEGLAHNHPLYAHWLASPIDEVVKAIELSSAYDMETDVISAVVALSSLRVLAHAKVYMISDGLSNDEIVNMNYLPATSIQDALDKALADLPRATIGILPQGGVSLPIVKKRNT